VLFWKFSKNRCFPSDQRAGGVAGGPKIFLKLLSRASSRIKKYFLFAKRPLTRPRRYPTRPTGGRSPEGHSARPTVGMFHQHYISTHLSPNFHIIQQKSGKTEREERKREEEAAMPHVGLELYSRSSRIIT
jgi:hypothetical protein